MPEFAPLHEVAELNPRRPAAGLVSADAPVSFVPMAAVDATSGRITSALERPFEAVRKKYTGFAEGDLLFAKITPCMENGKAAIARDLTNGVGFGSTEFHVIRTGQDLDAQYLHRFLRQRSVRSRAEAHMTGSVGQRRVPVAFLRDLLVPVPSPEEQRLIVETLDRVEGLLTEATARLDMAEETLEQFRLAVLSDACTGRLLEPPELRSREHSSARNNWIGTMLGAITVRVTSGSRGWAKYYSDHGPLFIRAQNLREDRLVLDGVAHVTPPANSEAQRTRVSAGDVLVTITGANVTKTGWVAAEIGEAYISQHVAIVRCADEAMSGFVYLWLLSPAHGRGVLQRDAYGAGKPGLNLQNIKEVPIVVPPPDLLPDIVRRALQLLALADTAAEDLSERRQRIEDLREAVLNAAFRGELEQIEAVLSAEFARA